MVDKCEKGFQYIISNLCYKLHNNKEGQGIKCSGSIFNRKVQWDYTSCFQATQHPASNFLARFNTTLNLAAALHIYGLNFLSIHLQNNLLHKNR